MDVVILPEMIEDQAFAIWNDQIEMQPGIYWYEVDPWELWWLSENRVNFKDWKELSVSDLDEIVQDPQKLTEDSFVYLPLIDLLKTAAIWKTLSEKPQYTNRLLVISEANPEISVQVKRSTHWKNISTSIRRLRQIYDEWIRIQPLSS